VGAKSIMGIRNFNAVAKKKILGRNNTAGAFAPPSLPMGAFLFARYNTSGCM
jgi:hypothetical protein